jgi:hypothetical protein
VFFGKDDVAPNLLAGDLALPAPAPQGNDGFVEIGRGLFLGVQLWQFLGCAHSAFSGVLGGVRRFHACAVIW